MNIEINKGAQNSYSISSPKSFYKVYREDGVISFHSGFSFISLGGSGVVLFRLVSVEFPAASLSSSSFLFLSIS